jgi:hypothetical protein
MEDLWRGRKEQVAACLEWSLDALLESCRRYFQNLSPQQALRTAGISYERCCSVDLLSSNGYSTHRTDRDFGLRVFISGSLLIRPGPPNSFLFPIGMHRLAGMFW